jgi:hypothetical protein
MHTSSWVFFATETPLRQLLRALQPPSVSDSIVAFTLAPTPCSRSSLSHAYRFMGFFRNQNGRLAASANPTTSSASDSIVAFTPAPTPCSRSSLSHAHSIHTPTLPTPTLLTFTCTQVLWFLPCLTRSRVSGVTTRPVTRLTIVSTRTTQCRRGVQILQL